MSRNVQFNLRIPSELKALVSEAAKASGRSINAEAQYRLEASFRDNEESYSEALTKLKSFFDVHLRSSHLISLAHKLNFLLNEAESVNSLNTPSITRVAEAFSYDNVLTVEGWFTGRKEPSFEELNKLAKYFGCRESWLIHNEGKPFLKENFEFGFNIKNNAERLLEGCNGNEVQALWFVRNDTIYGELVIIKHYDTWRGSVLNPRIHLCDAVGFHDNEYKALLTLTLKYLYEFRTPLIRGALVSDSDFNELIWAEQNPVKIIGKYNHNDWVRGIWDESLCSNKNDSYWKQWHNMCSSIAFQINRNEFSSKLIEK
ncbi:Arc family DNA-binding protein [Psychrobacter sp.]|uniref:Arc family DNA-binding protein n=1 Tax=Psychrobacter sp. TaxID=56811 RepID=UPI0025DDF627|nr:Arc family DNA-binding protein [Psychrobacter sp.]